MNYRTGLLTLITIAMAGLGCLEEGEKEEKQGGGDRIGWTVILGGDTPDEGGYPLHPHCLYRVPLDSGSAETVYCPDWARWIHLAWPPEPGHDDLLFIAEVDAHSGVYSEEFLIYEPWVRELYRVELSTGEPKLLGYYLADSFAGEEPEGAVHGARTLGGGRVAVHWTLPEAHGGRGEELVVIETEGTVGEDMTGDMVDMRLLDVLPDGNLLVRHTDGEGRVQLRALDPGGAGSADYAMPANSPLAEEVEDHRLHLEPGGDRVLLDVAGVPTVVSPGGVAAMAFALEWGEGLMGWAGDGGALLDLENVVWTWDGADGGDPVEIGVPAGVDGFGGGAVAHPAGDQGAVFRGYTLANDRDFLVWYRGGTLTPCETSLSLLEGESWAHGTEDLVALAYDSDWESGSRNQVFACDPDGTCGEILSRHGLRGVLLPSGPIW